MIALGMAPEAQAMLRVAAEDDPSEAASADTAGLAGIAALLAARTAEADGIDDPRLTGTDEIAFWRAVRRAQQDARLRRRPRPCFAVTVPLALRLPGGDAGRAAAAGVRDHDARRPGGAWRHGCWPAAADASEPGRWRAAWQREADGNVDGALADLRCAGAGADQLASARAAVRAVELRLAAGRIAVRRRRMRSTGCSMPGAGDRRDLAVRERLADPAAAERRLACGPDGAA